MRNIPCFDCGVEEGAVHLSTCSRNEVRVVDETTGGAKGSKPCQLGWLPAEAMMEVGKLYGFGAEKYEAHNFRKGFKFSLSLNALWRHLLLFQGGQDIDEESDCHHLAAVVFHALNLIQQGIDHPELDDRWNPTTEKSPTSEDSISSPEPASPPVQGIYQSPMLRGNQFWSNTYQQWMTGKEYFERKSADEAKQGQPTQRF